MRRAALLVAAALAALVSVTSVQAEDPIADAKRILAGAESDPSAIDRARDRLEDSLRASGVDRADPTLVIEASRLWWLYGELRASGSEARLAAFERGSKLGEDALRRAPSNPLAHLWYACNLGRWTEQRGIFDALLELHTVRHEVEETIRLAPDLPEAQVFAGSLASHVPGFLGGNDALAEKYYRRAVALDPRRTSFRLELATFLYERKRTDEAAREIRAVLAEQAPSDRLYATLHDRPLAKRLLAEIDAAGR